jgi:hypothetical protein
MGINGGIKMLARHTNFTCISLEHASLDTGLAPSLNSAFHYPSETERENRIGKALLIYRSGEINVTVGK